MILHRQHRPQGLRLGIAVEADALICNLGSEAYSIAVRRAEEASSDEMARDWSGVAVAIARKTQRRSLLSAMFH